ALRDAVEAEFAAADRTAIRLPQAEVDRIGAYFAAPSLGERPARDVAGPTADPSPAPRIVPGGGLMGPPAPQQGWAFTGGAAGNGTLPGGQSLPSQTTGTMPPPSSPGGAHP
ncbi:MAG: hypothetical protein B7X92_10215, partial [Novosphingobium sp. 17-62-9]